MQPFGSEPGLTNSIHLCFHLCRFDVSVNNVSSPGETDALWSTKGLFAAIFFDLQCRSLSAGVGVGGGGELQFLSSTTRGRSRPIEPSCENGGQVSLSLNGPHSHSDM